MHCVLLGVTRLLLGLWFDSTARITMSIGTVALKLSFVMKGYKKLNHQHGLYLVEVVSANGSTEKCVNSLYKKHMVA